MQTYTQLEHRPGDSPQLYDLDGGTLAQATDGKVVRLTASQQVTAVAPVPIESPERYLFRAVFRRATDSADPSDDAVACGIDWLAPDKTPLATTTIDTLLAFTVADGRRVIRRLVTATGQRPTEIAAPAGAAYAIPWVRTFGSDHQTDVEVCALEREIIGAALASLTVAVFQFDLRRSGERAGRAAERLETF